MPHVTNFKPPRGQYKAEQKAKKAEARSFEDEQKDMVRKRDGKRCRWPFCRHRRVALHVAHLVAKGMGGDPTGERSMADKMIQLCEPHHLWDPQEGHPDGCLEHHQLAIEPLTDRGTDGPCVFKRVRIVTTATGMEELWFEVARERSVGVLDTYGI
jgi:hypothetical protein